MRIISGIYKIVNVKNNKFYIGSSKNIIRRWSIHRSALKNNRHHSIYLQRSWNKHGPQAFQFEIIKEMSDPTEQQLFNEEIKYIKKLLPQYNIGDVGGGDNLTNNPNREDIIRRMTASIRERISKMSEQERKEIWSHPGNENPNWKGGKTFCECGARINSNSEKCIDCVDRSGKNNSFYGKHHSDNIRKILSQKRMGKTLSDETKEKCKRASINFYNSDDGKKYLREFSKKIRGKNHPLYGVGHTEESRKKMSKTRMDVLNDMSIEKRYKWNKMRKVRVVRIHDSYYFSLAEAMKHYSKSHASLRFRCQSTGDKWNEYEFIDILNYNNEQDADMIRKLTDTNLTPTLHT